MKKLIYGILAIALLSSCAFIEDSRRKGYAPEGAVDLGLSVFWAEANLGAVNYFSTGNFYAWGETGAKSSFDWSNYLWCEGTDETLNKYLTPTGDGDLNLAAEDDAAHAAMGEKWRIPTDTEYAELRMNCNWIWTTQGGVKGYKVVSNINGKSIFIPAAGYMEGSTVKGLGSDCAFWTASGCLSKPKYAFYTRLSDSEILLDATLRCNGLQIRPVSD